MIQNSGKLIKISARRVSQNNFFELKREAEIRIRFPFLNEKYRMQFI